MIEGNKKMNRVRLATILQQRLTNESSELQAFCYDYKKKYYELPSIVIGKIISICKYCNANNFKSMCMCCMVGKVKLPSLHVQPPQLFTYMDWVTPQLKHFLENIRRYNSCFQMTFFGTTWICNEGNVLVLFSKSKEKFIIE